MCTTPAARTATKRRHRPEKGLPRLREPWILKRGGVERLPEISSEYGRQRRDDHSLDALRFEHITLPLRAKKGSQITQLYYARQGVITPEWSTWPSAKT